MTDEAPRTRSARLARLRGLHAIVGDEDLPPAEARAMVGPDARGAHGGLA